MSSQKLKLNETQRALIGTVRDLARDKHWRTNSIKYMDGTFPSENLRELAKLGVMGMSVPEAYGGLALPVFDTALVLEEIAKYCYATAMGVLSSVGVQTRVISKAWWQQTVTRLLA